MGTKAATKTLGYVCFFVALCFLLLIAVLYGIMFIRGQKGLLEATLFFFSDDTAMSFMSYFMANAVIAGGVGTLLIGWISTQRAYRLWSLFLILIAGVELIWITENAVTWFMLPFHLYLLYTLIPYTGLRFKKAVS